MFFLLDGIEMEFLGILGAEFQQGQFVAPDGNPERHPFDFDIRQEGDDDLLCKGPELRLDFGDESAQDGGGLLLDLHPETEIEGLYDGPAADPEEIPESLVDVEHQRENVRGRIRRGGDDGLGIMLLQ